MPSVFVAHPMASIGSIILGTGMEAVVSFCVAIHENSEAVGQTIRNAPPPFGRDYQLTIRYNLRVGWNISYDNCCREY
jgi:hypothetical protein